LLAVAGLVAHFSLAQAFRLADAALVAPMDFARLPLIAAVGAFVYGETLAPSLLVGATIIVAANLINIIGERRMRR
jgi:drug/metabolite transporter (DMT)-like permease